jgi:hypothetical protein
MQAFALASQTGEIGSIRDLPDISAGGLATEMLSRPGPFSDSTQGGGTQTSRNAPMPGRPQALDH